jgi:hypothetical protein
MQYGIEEEVAEPPGVVEGQRSGTRGEPMGMAEGEVVRRRTG